VQRKRHIVVMIMTLAMVLTACGGGSASDDGSSVDVDALELSDAGSAGKTLFTAKCSTCHRGDLSGGTGPSLGPDSAASSKPTSELRAKIVGGGEGMPTWGGLLTDGEIDGLVAFLSEAQGR
jgi:cytochrome c551